MSTHEVVIAGGGPTGMMLAAELALAGVDVVIVERRADQALVGSRAGGLSARTLEIFDQRGIVDRFLAEGQKAQVTGFAVTRLDISDFPTRHNYGLGLWQNHIERIMAAWIAELKVPVRYGTDIVGFSQDERGVDIQISEGRTLRAQYFIGCDGGRSFVRKSAGIDFPGSDPTSSNIIAYVEMTEKPPMGVHRTEHGTHAFGRDEYEIVNGEIIYKDIGPIRVMVPDAEPASGEPTLEEFREALVRVRGTDYGAHSPSFLSRFSDMSRQAAKYRDRRVFLAGDAAHIHSPIGGQGLNTGVQDAVNLGWKLAQVIKGTSPDSLLDTYHAERHPVGARVLKTTMAQVLLHRTDDRSVAIRDIVGEFLTMDEPRKRIAAEQSQLGVRYDFGEGHPLLGRRMPDLDLVTDDESIRLYTLLHEARPVLINFGQPGAVEIGAWADRVQLVDAQYEGPWELPAIGAVSAPSAVLVRPDGHVAWVGERTQTGLTEALTKWFGT
jgi:3-(3-hydroxy-phenyl)propionate hydroxylase